MSKLFKGTLKTKVLGCAFIVLMFSGAAALVETVFSIDNYYMSGIWTNFLLISLLVTGVLLISNVAKEKPIRVGAWSSATIGWVVYFFGVTIVEFFDEFFGRSAGQITSAASFLSGVSYSEESYMKTSEVSGFFGSIASFFLVFAVFLTAAALFSLFRKKAGQYKFSFALYSTTIIGFWLAGFFVSLRVLFFDPYGPTVLAIVSTMTVIFAATLALATGIGYLGSKIIAKEDAKKKRLEEEEAFAKEAAIANGVVEYSVGTKETAGTSWSIDLPDPQDGLVIWKRTVVTHSNGNQEIYNFGILKEENV